MASKNIQLVKIENKVRTVIDTSSSHKILQERRDLFIRRNAHFGIEGVEYEIVVERS